MSTAAHLKHIKQHHRNRELLDLVVDLINVNDHNTLAYLARTTGIPPQLRHIVWPILLKYHPMCISPNVIPNTLFWDNNAHCYMPKKSNLTNIQNNTSSSSSVKSNNQNRTANGINDEKSLEDLIMKDLRKYFHIRKIHPKEEPITNTISNDSTKPSQTSSSVYTTVISPVDEKVLNLLLDAILSFLNKWSRICRYECGLSWIAIGLAEWFSLSPILINNSPMILTASKRAHRPSFSSESSSSSSTSNISPSIENQTSQFLTPLYNEYPLPESLKSKLKPILSSNPLFSFNDMFERLVLVIFHCPDLEIAQSGFLSSSSSLSTSGINNYFPIISGGDTSFQQQLFFKVFSSMLPELYQPLSEETSLQHSGSRNWIYWWMKCSGAKVLHKQDRARIWDLLLGWRPYPNMTSINFFLNYNSKKFDQLYNKNPKIEINEDLFSNEYFHNDTFWFPDLNTIPLGSKNFESDYNVFQEIVRRNKCDATNDSLIKKEISDINVDIQVEKPEIPFSLLDPHVQLIFIYVAMFQHFEFKLLEFEDTEITEFLNNVPIITKADNISFKSMTDTESISDQSNVESTSTTTTSPSSPSLSQSPSNGYAATSNNNHMLIELGNDGKSSHSFNDILNMAGDIWRKWMWKELQDTSESQN
ncbi:hypothetical protein TBLA_0G00620 [Henningerozyma blattae CBS 6284]|uniref:Rab-GAP TBC domain-containing protein n=1 Tax=Henningerozyma blattae (strain ATCC 34711 / CBS 6284 / DSM 70876 / NBRC 10599 / NRRL Y-10934 / UCD 77-7) TaxID=1071380 RepID=I2H6K9_HENB6|nr:hypothetical protein TBLA_0G00620 [Tetrapisispora blattae CBS 6284]CCH62011.1 hypothetical protein TBLA_0G00620 [Tetrapisispora blattae CBS 6284]